MSALAPLAPRIASSSVAPVRPRYERSAFRSGAQTISSGKDG